jgi:hypothetical protein
MTTLFQFAVRLNTRKNFVILVRQLRGIQGNFRCVLEEDGTEVVNEVLEAILEAREKIGVIMILHDGDNWSRGEYIFVSVISDCKF